MAFTPLALSGLLALTAFAQTDCPLSFDDAVKLACGGASVESRIATVKRAGIGFRPNIDFAEKACNEKGQNKAFVEAVFKAEVKPPCQQIAAARIDSFTLDPVRVKPNETATAKWAVANAIRVELDGQQVEPRGERPVRAGAEPRPVILRAVGRDGGIAHSELTLDVETSGLPEGPPLTLHQVILLLDAKVDPGKLEALVKLRRVAFAVLPSVAQLKEAGARDQLIGVMVLHQEAR